ncbi:MAG: S-methyl-5-thioribose-1-phosphate isomerase [Candidatus Eisenbacteria bacterium]|nr:S-methyl-5-thioribose-1-phosphate isomerase [Candidatus Eisenbacteria bacterium]
MSRGGALEGRGSHRTIEWLQDRVRLIDQTRLPLDVAYKETDDYRDIAESIRRLEVRGAPAIGVAAAMGVALAALEAERADGGEFTRAVREAAEHLRSTRPTAVNLGWAVDRMLAVLAAADPASAREALVNEAVAIYEEDRRLSRSIGEHGAELLEDGYTVLTHCNAGGLATAELGTALAVIYVASEQGKRVHVIADETRPLLQGARLTTWELIDRGIDVTLQCDSAAAGAIAGGLVDCVIVGADRIAGNGDVANKIGTLSVALAADRFGVPFYVAAPTSTLDASLASGGKIPIEERAPDEVTVCGGTRVAPPGVAVRNPAFDVTPAELVSAVITDRGVFRPPYDRTLFGKES